jgi:hypothetical protein
MGERAGHQRGRDLFELLAEVVGHVGVSVYEDVVTPRRWPLNFSRSKRLGCRLSTGRRTGARGHGALYSGTKTLGIHPSVMPSPYASVTSDLRGLEKTATLLAGLLTSAVTLIVVEPVGRRLPLGQPPVLGEASKHSIATVDPTASVGSARFVLLHHDDRGEMGRTSEPQAGHQYTSSGRRRISGCPHSQAWRPVASGSSVI